MEIHALRVGDVVEVLSKEEILRTLDADGRLEDLPFMAEMVQFCGRRVRISAIAHKTCDTVNRSGGRKMENAVHLEDLRCNGAFHGGCQAECLLFWKTAWLKRSNAPAVVATDRIPLVALSDIEYELDKRTKGQPQDGPIRYQCQATQLFEATKPLAWWDARQYWSDVRFHNVTAWHAISTLILGFVFNLRRLPVGYSVSCWLYERMHVLLRKLPAPHLVGRVEGRTPDLRLGLKLGEQVEVLSKREIEATIDGNNKNRGLHIDEEMTAYCGKQFRVTNRVTQIINESTGEMMHFRNPCIVLDGVVCRGNYSDKRLLCPRRITTYWREAWLKRVDDESRSQATLEQ